MNFTKKQRILGLLLLLYCTVAWGSGFLLLKVAIEANPPVYVVGVRFFLASIFLGLIFFKKIKKINKRLVLDALVLGVVVFLAYCSQTIGLKHTTPSRNAFVTSLYCVMCPFFIWAIYKIIPKAYHLISAFICVVGIGLISFSNGFSFDSSLLIGDGLTFISAIFFALQIICIDEYKKRDDLVTLLIVQMFITAILLLSFSAIFEIKDYGIKSYLIRGNNLFNVLYLTIFATLLAQMAQAIGLRYTTPNEGALILCLESVFGALFSVLFGDEKITLMLGLGFAVIFIAVLISQLHFKPLEKRAKIKMDENVPKESENDNLK